MKKSLLKLYPSTMIYSSFSNSNSNPKISRILGKKIIFFRCVNIFDSALKFSRYKPTEISAFHGSQFNWNSSDSHHKSSSIIMLHGRNGKKSPPKPQPKRRGNRQRNKNNPSDTSPDSKKQKVLNLNDNFTTTPIVVSPAGIDKTSPQTSTDQPLDGSSKTSEEPLGYKNGVYEGMEEYSTPPSLHDIPRDIPDLPTILRDLPPLPDSPPLSPTTDSNPHLLVKKLIQNFELPQNESTTSDKRNVSTSTSKDTGSNPVKDTSKKPSTNIPNPPVTKPILKTSDSMAKSIVDLTDSTSALKKATFEEEVLEDDFDNSSSKKKFSGKSSWFQHATYCSLMFTIPSNVEDKLSNVKWVLHRILTTITASDSSFRILPFEGVYERRDNLTKIFEPFLKATSELPLSAIQIQKFVNNCRLSIQTKEQKMYCQIYVCSNKPMDDLISQDKYNLSQLGINLFVKSTQVAKSDIHLFCYGLYTFSDLPSWNAKAQKCVSQRKQGLKFSLVSRQIQNGTSAQDSTAEPKNGVYVNVASDQQKAVEYYLKAFFNSTEFRSQYCLRVSIIPRYNRFRKGTKNSQILKKINQHRQ